MPDKKIKVLYDATLLSYFSEKNEKRSGVYFVTYNILKEILNHPEFEVTLYCDYKRTLYMQQLMKQDEMLRQFKLMEVKDITNPLIGLLASMNFKFRKAPEIKDNILKKAVRFIAFRSFHIYDRIRNDSPAFKKKLQEYDAYFSPYEIIPQEVEKDKTIKKFLFLHDTIPVILEDLYNEINLSSDWFRRLLKSLNKEDFYFANSLSTKNDFIKYAPSIIPENITVAYLGADEKFCRTTDEEKILQIKRKYNIPEDKKYIFSLCSVEPRKNLIFAVKNFVEFIKKNNIDDFVFVFGGGQVKQFQPKLEKELSDLREFQDKILKIGYVADEDLALLYSGAEMFVYPSIYEGFGMPVLEAMQCGTPVITSNVSSLPEVIGDAGIRIDPYKNEELIAAYEKMYFDRNFREQCIQKSLERAKEFSWEKCVDIITGEIKKAAGK